MYDRCLFAVKLWNDACTNVQRKVDFYLHFFFKSKCFTQSLRVVNEKKIKEKQIVFAATSLNHRDNLIVVQHWRCDKKLSQICMGCSLNTYSDCVAWFLSVLLLAKQFHCMHRENVIRLRVIVFKYTLNFFVAITLTLLGKLYFNKLFRKRRKSVYNFKNVPITTLGTRIQITMMR